MGPGEVEVNTAAALFRSYYGNIFINECQLHCSCFHHYVNNVHFMIYCMCVGERIITESVIVLIVHHLTTHPNLFI